jgi:hypothetical protein
MKRAIGFLIIVMIFLTACADLRSPVSPAAQTAVPAATAVPVQALPTTLPATPTVTQPAQVPVTGGETAPAQPEAVVGVDGLNLRAGPGMNYRVLAVLLPDQVVRLEGRSNSGAWVVVRRSDGTAGWVYSAYLKYSADLMTLRVAEAAGGVEGSGPETTLPESPSQPAPVKLPGKYTLYMSITDNQAVVSLITFPADSDITITLSTREGPAMLVASGKTDARGSASFTFAMPRYWPDGSPITQSALRLTAATVDGSVTRSANVTYYSGE